MSRTRNMLPLFPLSTMLFPGEAIPLQIFEHRYRQMLTDCTDGDSRFGILLIKTGPEVGRYAVTHEIGTVAQVTQVSDVGGGRFFVSAGGKRRFRLVQRHPDDSYPVGDVKLLDDEPGTGDLTALPKSVEAASHDLLKLTRGLGGDWTGDRELTDDPTSLSYYIPKLLHTDETEKKILLEAGTTMERLGIEGALLTAQDATLKARASDGLQRRFSQR